MFVTPLLHRKCPPSAMWCMRLRHTDRPWHDIRRKSLGQEGSRSLFYWIQLLKKLWMLDVFLISDQSAVGENIDRFCKFLQNYIHLVVKGSMGSDRHSQKRLGLSWPQQRFSPPLGSSDRHQSDESHPTFHLKGVFGNARERFPVKDFLWWNTITCIHIYIYSVYSWMFCWGYQSYWNLGSTVRPFHPFGVEGRVTKFASQIARQSALLGDGIGRTHGWDVTDQNGSLIIEWIG